MPKLSRAKMQASEKLLYPYISVAYIPGIDRAARLRFCLLASVLLTLASAWERRLKSHSTQPPLVFKRVGSPPTSSDAIQSEKKQA